MSVLPTVVPARPVRSSLTRRSLLGGVVAATLFAAACSADPAPPSSPAGPREFIDSTGRTVSIPATPQRIVALHEYAIGQSLLSIGAPVVGMNIRNGTFDQSVASRYDLSKVTPVGEILDYNLEAIAGLAPDLIVALSYQGKPRVGEVDPAKFEAIAPTVYIEQLVGVDDFMAQMGTLSNRMTEVEAQKAAWETAFGTARQDLVAATADLSFALVGWFAPTVYIASGASNDPIVVLGRQLGMVLPPSTAKATTAKEAWTELSEEKLDEADVDLIVWSDDSGDPSTLPLWKTLPAVKAKQAVKIDARPPAGSYASYRETLPILQKLLTGRRADVVDEKTWASA